MGYRLDIGRVSFAMRVRIACYAPGRIGSVRIGGWLPLCVYHKSGCAIMPGNRGERMDALVYRA